MHQNQGCAKRSHWPSPEQQFFFSQKALPLLSLFTFLMLYFHFHFHYSLVFKFHFPFDFLINYLKIINEARMLCHYNHCQPFHSPLLFYYYFYFPYSIVFTFLMISLCFFPDSFTFLINHRLGEKVLPLKSLPALSLTLCFTVTLIFLIL